MNHFDFWKVDRYERQKLCFFVGCCQTCSVMPDVVYNYNSNPEDD